MTNTTEMVLTGGFAATLCLFVVCAYVRGLRDRRGHAPLLEKYVDAQSPYASPAEIAAPLPLPPPLPVGRVPVWFYRPLDLAGIAIVFLVFAGLVLMSFYSEKKTASQLDAQVLVVNIVFQFVLSGLIAFSVVIRTGWATWLGLRWAKWPWVLLIAPAAVVFMWLIFAALQISGYMKWMESLGVDTMQDTVRLLKESSDPAAIGLMVVSAAIVAPLCEEIVFRGYLYPVMKRFAGPWPAAICTAFLFAAAHGSLMALLPLFLFGALLIFVYEKTGSIWAPIAVHCCFNSATVVIQLAARYFDFNPPT